MCAYICNLYNTRIIIEGAVRQECNKVKKDEAPKWINCPGKRRKWSSVPNSCYKILHDLAKKELESTAFILRLLAKSMIDITKTQGDDDGKTITLIYTGKRDFSDLTGKWENEGTIFYKKFRKVSSLCWDYIVPIYLYTIPSKGEMKQCVCRVRTMGVPLCGTESDNAGPA